MKNARCGICKKDIEPCLTPLSFNYKYITIKSAKYHYDSYICTNHTQTDAYVYLFHTSCRKPFFFKDYISFRFGASLDFDIKKITKNAKPIRNYYKGFNYEQLFPKFDESGNLVEPRIRQYKVIYVPNRITWGYVLNFIPKTIKPYLFDEKDWAYDQDYIEMTYEEFLEDPEEAIEREKKVFRIKRLKRKTEDRDTPAQQQQGGGAAQNSLDLGHKDKDRGEPGGISTGVIIPLEPEGAVDVSAAVQKKEAPDIVDKNSPKIAEQRKGQARITVQRSNLVLIVGDTKVAFPYFMIKSAVADERNVTISLIGDEMSVEADEPEELVREIESRIKKGYRIRDAIVRSPLNDPIKSIKVMRSRKGIEYEIPEADNRSRIEKLISTLSNVAGMYGTMEMEGLKILLPVYVVFDSHDSAPDVVIRTDWEIMEGMKEEDVVRAMITLVGKGAAETIPKEGMISSIFTLGK